MRRLPLIAIALLLFSIPACPQDVRSEVYTVPVHFHVIIHGNSYLEGYVSDAQIKDQMEVINEAFKSAGFRFELSSVERTPNMEWQAVGINSKQEAQIKQTLRSKDSTARDLNIYTTSLKGVELGWATFPDDAERFPEDDGIMLDYFTVPNTFSRGGYNLGRTAIHECSHYLGLRHLNSDPGNYMSQTATDREMTHWNPEQIQLMRQNWVKYRQNK